MKHLKVIQHDFLKVADWRERTRQWQRGYLGRHPQSKLRETGDLCSNCNYPLNIKDHGTWVGYHCPNCGRGGSRPKSGHINRFRHQMPQRQLAPQLSQDVKNALMGESTIDIDPRFYNEASKTYSFELSDVNLGLASQTVYLRDPKTDTKIKFDKYKTDKDATDEDTYGWHYKSEDGQYELLIIND